MTRPNHLVVVTGTSTDVGKTWISERVLGTARAAGLHVGARKPAQSFDAGEDAAGITDAQVLAAATGEDPLVVCPADRWYAVAMAPPMAADRLGRTAPSIDELAHEIMWPAAPIVELGLVETAGGVRSPLATDGDAGDLIDRLRPDTVVLVADAGLGAINAVLLSVEALGPCVTAAGTAADGPGSGATLLVVLNRFDPADDLHARNRTWLEDHRGIATFDAAQLIEHLVDQARRARR